MPNPTDLSKMSDADFNAAYADAVWKASAAGRANKPMPQPVSDDAISKDYLPDAVLTGGLLAGGRAVAAGLLEAGAVGSAAPKTAIDPFQANTRFSTKPNTPLFEARPLEVSEPPPGDLELSRWKPDPSTQPPQPAPATEAPALGKPGHGGVGGKLKKGLLTGALAGGGMAAAHWAIEHGKDALKEGAGLASGALLEALPDSVTNKVGGLLGDGPQNPLSNMSDEEFNAAYAAKLKQSQKSGKK